jgi:hypothetical protein
VLERMHAGQLPRQVEPDDTDLGDQNEPEGPNEEADTRALEEERDRRPDRRWM